MATKKFTRPETRRAIHIAIQRLADSHIGVQENPNITSAIAAAQQLANALAALDSLTRQFPAGHPQREALERIIDSAKAPDGVRLGEALTAPPEHWSGSEIRALYGNLGARDSEIARAEKKSRRARDKAPMDDSKQRVIEALRKVKFPPAGSRSLTRKALEYLQKHDRLMWQLMRSPGKARRLRECIEESRKAT